jgi:hypothetical protein
VIQEKIIKKENIFKAINLIMFLHHSIIKKIGHTYLKGDNIKNSIILINILIISFVIILGCLHDTNNNQNSKNQYNGIFEIGFKISYNKSTINISIIDLENNTIYSDSFYSQEKTYKSFELNLSIGEYLFYINTSSNLELKFNLKINESTPNEVYLIVIEKDKIESVGFPLAYKIKNNLSNF